MILVATLLFVVLVVSWLLAPSAEPVAVEAEAIAPVGSPDGATA